MSEQEKQGSLRASAAEDEAREIAAWCRETAEMVCRLHGIVPSREADDQWPCRVRASIDKWLCRAWVRASCPSQPEAAPPSATETAAPPQPRLARHQPCGCVVCRCEDEQRCGGCGAKSCGTHRVGEIPNPVYGPATEETP